MREIQDTAVERQLPQLLDDVEQGETILITRHGRAIARLVPEQRRPTPDEVQTAIEGIKALRKQNGPMSVAEILSARDEGRRF